MEPLKLLPAYQDYIWGGTRLRTEFGKIPAPGVGDTDGPGISKQKLDAMGYRDRLQYASKHPDEYQKLMGR